MADPQTATDLAYLSATEALALFRRRALSPVELLDALIARAEAVGDAVNAFTWERFDQAREEARAAEARYAGDASAARPLEGIPVAIKDEMAIAGQPVTYASQVFADHVADTTAPLAGRVLAAGGIVHTRTTQPEFACAGFTHSKLFGDTRNPWNLAFDVGGSSGGSAAALAAGLTMLAGGSDIGGSIRIPASCCGVVGYKPAYGRVPQDPPFNLDHYCHEGPLARTVADCALFANVISGPDPRDIVSLRERVVIPDELGDVRDWKVALSVDLDEWDVDPDVRRNTLAAADALRDAGATVEPVEIGWDRRAIVEAATIHFGSIFGAWIAGVAAEHRDALTPYALEFAATVEAVAPGLVLRGYELEGEICGRLGAVLEDYRLLLCPTLAVPALAAGEAAFADPRARNWGAGALPASDHLMTIPFNIASRCPVISMPSGFSADGVPTGVQVVARTYADVDAFHAAAAIERLGPWANGTRPDLGG
jgi:Asp-tRNA(Asn)/Glu-tRNA(Gln) amidotransferase A subunit family amidase